MENSLLQKALSPVIIVDANTLDAYRNVRIKVFVEEQEIDLAEEFDVYDEQPSTVHLAVRSSNSEDKDDIVGVCRIIPSGPYVKLGRVAVLKEHRGSGMGEALTLGALIYSRREFPLHTVVAHAQVEKLDFYSRLGFVVVSEAFLDEVDIWHRTIFYPNSNQDYLLKTQYPQKKLDFSGDCYDMTVIHRIRKIMSSSFVPLSSLVSCIGDGVGRCRRQFMEVAYCIQNEQMKLYGDLLDVGFQPKCLSISEAKSLLETLIRAGWERLNCGFYADVPEYWRSFYAAVKLCEAVLLETEGKLQECLSSVDNGILMGRQESLPGSRMLSEYAARFHRKIPEVEMDWELMSSSTISPPSPVKTDASAWWTIKEFTSLSDVSVSDCLSSGLPFVIRGGAKEWKAMEKWSFPFLTRLAGYRTVPVEIGSRYDGDDWTQKLMTIQQFVRQFVLTTSADEPGYLAQHRLLDQIPELLDDVETTFVSPFGCDIDWNAWFGPAGTVSSMHHDPRENFFVQIVGEKFFRLAHGCDTGNLYPRDDILKNTSQIDLEAPDFEWFPEFKKVHVEDVVLHPGDILYIPKEFWHFVKSLTPSMSVSAWFDQE